MSAAHDVSGSCFPYMGGEYEAGGVATGDADAPRQPRKELGVLVDVDRHDMMWLSCCIKRNFRQKG